MQTSKPDALTREEIRSAAGGLGFVACGFTDARPLAATTILQGWLDAGRHGDMDYLARDVQARCRPQTQLPEAATVIAVAWPYPQAAPTGPNWTETLTGRIAAYAIGDDYHKVLADRLRDLEEIVCLTTGGSCTSHVDSGPLLEKDLARRAGLGWSGHNTNILSPTAGSYLLLGLIITDAVLPPDPPYLEDGCGSCRACVPACPTGALDDGPTIDARLCISYLTIEHRGPIPIQLRSSIGNWVFGCDACQEVCPVNTAPSDPPAWLTPYLPDLLTLTRDEFRSRYAHTAVSRAKRRGLARNAAVVMGNSGNIDAVGPLELALRTHDEALVRSHAAWALGRFAQAQARTALNQAEPSEAVPPVRREIERALARDDSHRPTSRGRV